MCGSLVVSDEGGAGVDTVASAALLAVGCAACPSGGLWSASSACPLVWLDGDAVAGGRSDGDVVDLVATLAIAGPMRCSSIVILMLGAAKSDLPQRIQLKGRLTAPMSARLWSGTPKVAAESIWKVTNPRRVAQGLKRICAGTWCAPRDSNP